MPLNPDTCLLRQLLRLKSVRNRTPCSSQNFSATCTTR